MKTTILITSLLVAASGCFGDVIYDISINDPAFSGPGSISLQFAAVGAPATGTATISGVTTASLFGPVAFSQNATGTLPADVTLTSGVGTAELFQELSDIRLPLRFLLSLDTVSPDPLSFSLQLFEEGLAGDCLDFTIDWDGASWQVGALPSSVSVSAVPEPSSLALLGAGFLGIVAFRRGSRRQKGAKL